MPEIARSWDGGYIRKDRRGRDVYYIRRMVDGRRFDVSTRCHTSTAAHEQLKKFEADPFHYRPGDGGDQEATSLNADNVGAFLEWSRDAKRNTPKWIRDQRRALAWWLEVLGAVDLRRVETAQLVKALDGEAARKQKIAALKAFASWLVKERHALKKGDDPTSGLRIPQASPEQWKTPKAVSRAVFEKVREHLESPWREALEVLAGTGWHATELDRFARSGSVSKHPNDPKSAVLDCPQTKAGDPLRTQVSATVAKSARAILKVGAVDYHRFRKATRRASHLAGVRPALQPGHLRHSVATWAVNKGTPVAVVSSFLNHKATATTKRFYATFGVPAKVPTLL